jgi:uncharacterized damage-inducible protein DinB
VSGVGGKNDVRERQKEFDAPGPVPASILLEGLRKTLDDASTVLQGLDPETLLDPLTIQGNQITVLEAIYHVVEHFSMHTGQIIYITKMRTGADLNFYEVTREGHAFPTWH